MAQALRGTIMQSCYIYGAGIRGLSLKEQLSKIPIKVLGYIDAADEKIGKSFSGVPCLSLDEAVGKKRANLYLYHHRMIKE